MRKVIFLIFCALIFLCHFSCKAIKGDSTGIIVFYTGTITITGKDGVEKKAALKTVINSGDSVATAKSSQAIIQINDNQLIRVLAETVMSFDFLHGKDMGTSLSLKNGSIYSKLKKGLKYQITTPTATASVRGTEFLTSYKENSSNMQIYEGNVIVSTKDSKEKDVKTGKYADIRDNKIEINTLSKIEMMRLEKLSVPEIIEKPDSLSDKEMASIYYKNNSREEAIQKKIDEELEKWDRLSPVQKLRAQGKPLSEITIRDKSVIIGSVINQTRNSIVLDTGAGIIRIPKNDIIRRNMIK